MSVDDWARREAEKDERDWPVDHEAEPGVAGNAFQRGIVHAFDALLSDEAVRELVEYLIIEGYDVTTWDGKAALQAAINAVTKGDTP